MFNNMLMGAAGESIKATSFPVDNSLLINDGDNQYLQKKNSGASSSDPTNADIGTISVWFKRGDFPSGNNLRIWNHGDGTSPRVELLIMGSSNKLMVNGGATSFQLETTQVFRDPHAWYHAVVRIDTGQSTASNRVRLYVNGELVSDYGTETQPSQNQDVFTNSADWWVGRWSGSTGHNWDGYVSELVYCDGQSLAPTAFGETDSNGVWRPIDPTSNTFGDQGFYLPFTTAAGLGQDYSGSSTESKVQENTYNAGSEVNNGDMSGSAAGFVYTAIATAKLATVKINSSSRGFTNVTVQVQTDNGSNAPDGTTLTNGEVTGITGSGTGLKTVDFPNGGPELTAGTKYWIVIPSTDLGSGFEWGIQHDVAGSGGALGIIDSTGYKAGRGFGHEVFQLGNHFTAVNSPTQTTDTCTNNAATLSPLWTDTTLSNGNLKAVATGNSYQWAISTIAIPSSGKWTFEAQSSNIDGSSKYGYVGICQMGNHNAKTGNNYIYGINAGSGEVVKNSSALVDVGASPLTSLMRIEYDADNDTIKIFDDDTEIFPASTGVSNTVGLTGQNSLHFFVAPYGSGADFTVTFKGLSDTPTSGYLELNTTNLLTNSTPTIEDGSVYHQTSLWEGDITARKITQSGFNSTFQPDWIWGKNRDNTSGYSYRYFDSVRGATKVLQTGGSSYTDPEATDSNGVTDFEVDGFDIGNGVHLNGDGEDIVAWQWAAGGEPTVDNDAGAGATPTAGSVKIDGSNLGSSLGGTIPVTRLSANRKSGFSIGTYTGSGSNGTIATGLTTKPDMLIIKKRGDDGGNNWVTYHSGLANQGTGYVDLGTNAAEGTLANMFNSVAPGSSDATLFNVGTNTSTNDTGGSDTYVFYCFHSVSGYSKFGTYIGNGGSGDGPLVNLGFSPSWILYRNISASAGWRVFDSARDTSNVVEQSLTPNTTNAEKGDQSNVQGDFLSNGWKVRNPSNTGDGGNVNNNVYIYAAFAEHPFAGTTPATAR